MAHRSDRRPRIPAAALVVVLLLVGAVACTGPGGSAPPPASSAQRATVTYRVTGDAASVTVRYGNKHHIARIEAPLPWSHVGSAFEGTTVLLRADQPKSKYGYRLVCTLSMTITGHDPLVSRDSSHIVGIKAEGGSQDVLYDGTCNTSQVVSLTGL